MELTIGIPAFNEEKNIAAIIINLKKLATKITQILMFPEVAQEMANQAFKCGNPNAVEKLQQVVTSVVDRTLV